MRLLEMSISAGALILIVMILRRNAWWNLAKQTVMMLWLVVLFRLLLPGSLPIRKGIVSPIFCILRRTGIGQTETGASDAAGTGAAAGLSKAASFGRGVYPPDLRQAAVWIWLILAAGVGIYFIRVFYREYRLLAEALPLKSAVDSASMRAQILEARNTARRLAGISMQRYDIQILVHDRIRSPLVFGVIKQKIIIPKSFCLLEPTQMQQILVHEMVHIRRFDNFWKLLSAAALCMHWFNPAVWLMYVLFARDMEFELVSQTEDKLFFVLQSDEHTLEKYPFPFKLIIGYQLIDSSVKVSWKVENTGKEPMYFSIGAHPAFLCPIHGEQDKLGYGLYFKGLTDTLSHHGNTPEGMAVMENEILPLKEGCVTFTEGFFDKCTYMV